MPASAKRSSTRSPRRSLFTRVWPVIALLLAGFCGWMAFTSAGPGSDVRDALAANSAQISETTPSTRYVTANIQDVKRFDWLLADNPEGGLVGEDVDAIDWREWRFIDTRFTKPDGTISEVNLARPVAWVEKQEAEVGGRVYLDLAEMGIEGWADVVAVSPAPDPGPRPSSRHSLVTATFKHTVTDLIDLHIEGTDPIGCTPNHPFWSVDRQEFVEAGELRPDECVLLASGDTRRVLKTLPRPGPETVYNLEVFGEHVYYVGTSGVLVHNTCKGFRVMSKREYEQAKRGIWNASKYARGDARESRVKWLWKSMKSARRWLKFLRKHEREDLVIVEVPTAKPLASYPGYAHPPQGRAVEVPTTDLGIPNRLR